MDKAKKEASISVHAAKAYLALKGTAKRCEGVADRKSRKMSSIDQRINKVLGP